MKGKKINKQLTEWHENEVEFDVDGKHIHFTIISNLGDNIDACISNWIPRTKKFTAQSLIDYINSKQWADQYAYKNLDDLLANHPEDII